MYFRFICDPRIDGTGAFDGDLAECPDSQVIGGSGERAVSILCSFKRRCFLDVFPDLRCCGDGVCIAATALFFGMMAGVSLIFKLDLSGIRPCSLADCCF